MIKKKLHYGFMKLFPPDWGKDVMCKLESPFALNVFLDNSTMKCKRCENSGQYFRSTHEAHGWVEMKFYLLSFFAWVDLLHFVVVGPHKFGS